MLNQKLITQLLSAASALSFKYINSISTQLKTIAGSDEISLQMIADFVKKAKRQNYWERFYPLIVLLITLVICVLIYSASQ